MRWKAAFLGIVLAGCANAPPGVTYQLSSSDKSAVEAGVRASLKDPGSAKFGTFWATKAADGKVSVCGWINAKNGFGGYTGDLPFVGTLNGTGFSVAEMGAQPQGEM